MPTPAHPTAPPLARSAPTWYTQAQHPTGPAQPIPYKEAQPIARNWSHMTKAQKVTATSRWEARMLPRWRRRRILRKDGTLRVGMQWIRRRRRAERDSL